MEGEAKIKDVTNVRVIQRTLVYVIGIPQKYATDENLRKNDWFGQFGTIKKIVINKRLYNLDTTVSAYITFKTEKEAADAIAETDESLIDGNIIKSTYGTTKYCTFYLKNMVCQNYECMYLHSNGETKDAITKDEMYIVKHKLHDFEAKNKNKTVLGKIRESNAFHLLFKYKSEKIFTPPEKIKFRPIDF